MAVRPTRSLAADEHALRQLQAQTRVEFAALLPSVFLRSGV